MIVATEILEEIEVGVDGARRTGVPETHVAQRNFVRHVRIVDADIIRVLAKGVAATTAGVVTLVRAQPLLLAVLERNGDVAASVVDVLAKHGGHQHGIGIASATTTRTAHARRRLRSRA